MSALASGLFVVLVAAPVVEEAVFRAGLQELLLLRGWHEAVANLATAAVFVLAHALTQTLRPLHALGVAGSALLLGWLYGRTRRLRLCIAAHAGMNAVGVAVLQRLVPL
jgi:membrane protease YdiL (CAAX protease family)